MTAEYDDRARKALSEMKCTPELGPHDAKKCPKCVLVGTVGATIQQAVDEAVARIEEAQRQKDKENCEDNGDE